MQRTTIRLDDNLHQDLKDYCDDNDIKFNDLVSECLVTFLQNKDKKSNSPEFEAQKLAKTNKGGIIQTSRLLVAETLEKKYGYYCYEVSSAKPEKGIPKLWHLMPRKQYENKQLERERAIQAAKLVSEDFDSDTLTEMENPIIE
jgi:hypothetical protein